MLLQTSQISQPAPQTGKYKCTLFVVWHCHGGGFWSQYTWLVSLDETSSGFVHLPKGLGGFTYFSKFIKRLTSSQVRTFLCIGSSCLSLIYNKCRCSNCSAQTSQCQLMLAFSKSSCCPICPHMAAVAHSVVQESFEGAFCSVLDNHFQSVSCLFW